MLIQRAGTPGGTIPPQGFAPPPWMTSFASPPALILPDALLVSRRPALSNLIELPEQVFTVGHDDFEDEDPKTSVGTTSEYEFGWDNEHPRRQVVITKPVLVERLCITNAEYLAYFRLFKDEKKLQTPESWVVSPDEPEVGLKVRYYHFSLPKKRN